MEEELHTTDAVDPVCGMKIERPHAAAETEFEGTHFYFCSETCRTRFLEDPKRYATKGQV